MKATEAPLDYWLWGIGTGNAALAFGAMVEFVWCGHPAVVILVAWWAYNGRNYALEAVRYREHLRRQAVLDRMIGCITDYRPLAP